MDTIFYMQWKSLEWKKSATGEKEACGESMKYRKEGLDSY